MTIFLNAINSWNTVLKVDTPKKVEKVDGRRAKLIQTRVAKGVYKQEQGKMLRYVALGFPGEGKKVHLYWGPSKEDAIKARQEWEKQNVIKPKKIPKISLTYFP